MKVCVRPRFFTDRASSCEFKDSRTSNITMKGKAARGRGYRGATVGLLKLPPCQGTFMLFSSQGQREIQEKNIRRTHLQ